MRPRSWWSVYLPIAGAALILCVLFHRVLGPLHIAALVGVSMIAPLTLATLGGRAVQDVEPAPAGRAAAKLRWVVPVLFGVAFLKFAAVGWSSSRFIPAVHDEWSYLFGAETFARGRLVNATPPDADSLDAFHILTEPYWMTRYPPGHPAVLAIGVLLGAPWVVLCALMAGTVVWVYLLGRSTAGGHAGWIAALLAFLSPGLDSVGTGYLSQSTFLFTITGCFVCVISAAERSSALLAALGGVLGGWAILTRPYSAAALGLPLALWFVVRCIRTGLPGHLAGPSRRAAGWVRLMAGVVPVAGAVALFGAYNQRSMGSPWLTAWQEYNYQFEPDNSLGFAGRASQPIPEAIHLRKRLKAEQIAREKRAFTWREAARRALADPGRLSQIVFSSLGFYGLLTFVPFACAANAQAPRHRATATLLLAAIATHYAAYSFFYSTWGAYAQETIPLVVVVVACGLYGFWRRARDSDRPTLVLIPPLAGAATLCLISFIQMPRFVAQRTADTAEHRRFQEKTQAVAADGAILVLVEIDPDDVSEYDLIYNTPDLDGNVIVALDIAARNVRLVERFPDRRVFVYEQATEVLRPWVRPVPESPARWPYRSAPQVASSRATAAGR